MYKIQLLARFHLVEEMPMNQDGVDDSGWEKPFGTKDADSIPEAIKIDIPKNA